MESVMPAALTLAHVVAWRASICGWLVCILEQHQGAGIDGGLHGGARRNAAIAIPDESP
jgi:hypothetical protein